MRDRWTDRQTESEQDSKTGSDTELGNEMVCEVEDAFDVVVQPEAVHVPGDAETERQADKERVRQLENMKLGKR